MWNPHTPAFSCLAKGKNHIRRQYWAELRQMHPVFPLDLLDLNVNPAPCFSPAYEILLKTLKKKGSLFPSVPLTIHPTVTWWFMCGWHCCKLLTFLRSRRRAALLSNQKHKNTLKMMTLRRIHRGSKQMVLAVMHGKRLIYVKKRSKGR